MTPSCGTFRLRGPNGCHHLQRNIPPRHAFSHGTKLFPDVNGLVTHLQRGLLDDLGGYEQNKAANVNP